MDVKENQPLNKLCSFGVGGFAKTLMTIYDRTDLDNISDHSATDVWFLGEGTNTLISDHGLPGLTLLIKNQGISIDNNVVTAQAGTSWDDLVALSIEHDLWGLELMSGIPGSVGAGVAGNIAAYGQAVANSLNSVSVFDLHSSQHKSMSADNLGFAYRHSMFKDSENSHLVVTSASFTLSTKPTTDLKYAKAQVVADRLGLDVNNIKDRRSIIMQARKEAGSLLVQGSEKTAGSFYKNPVVAPEVADYIMSFEEQSNISKSQILKTNKVHSGESLRVPAAHVLLAAGFTRGQQWGQVRLHPDHILKIVNMGSATAQEIYNVHLNITDTVKEKLGTILEPEVKFLGKF